MAFRCANTSIFGVEYEHVDSSWCLAFGVLFAVMAVISTLGNGIMLVTLCKFPILRTASKILMSLIVTYLLAGLVLCPLMAVQLLYIRTGRDKKEHHMARIHRLIVHLSIIICGACVFTLVYLAYDKYKRLTQLHQYTMRPCKSYILLALCWVVPIILVVLTHAVPIFLRCKLGLATLILLLYVIAVISLIAMVIALNRNLKHRANITHGTYMEKVRKESRTVIILIFTNVILALPLLVFYGTQLSSSNATAHSRTYIAGCFFCFMASIIHPVIVFCRNSTIRRCMLRLFGMSSKLQSNRCSNVSENMDGRNSP